MNLTLNKIQECIKLLGKEPGFRKPVYHFCPYIGNDNVYYGELVDKMMKIKDPYFDPEYHQGFLIPIKHKKQIEELEAENDQT